ncbi:hypothetical protein GOB93_08950 [Acetobacter musti]|uniref:Uncharacterized protein n=1 Tax=Acetobacter musti TaxID=864732 RepID=A0ABX0JPS3_9PROT|nr:hypothetical protein [Acetobacter musti]NHN84769.1 hypothetical protein [Acetobacter musti]
MSAFPPINPAAERAYFERRFAELMERNQEQDRYIRGLRALVSRLQLEVDELRATRAGQQTAEVLEEQDEVRGPE